MAGPQDLDFSSSRFVKALNELTKKTQELSELQGREAQIVATLNKEKEIEAIEAQKAAIVEKAQREQTVVFNEVMNKVTGDMEKQGRAIGRLGDTFGLLDKKLSVETTKKLAIFAAGLGAATASVGKWVNGTQQVILSSRMLEKGNIDLFDAFVETAKGVFKTGLSAEQLASVMHRNRNAFLENREGIFQTTSELKGFARVMGIGREELTELVAKTSEQRKGSTNLTKDTKEYLQQLQILAIQTGRSVTEVEEERAARRKSVESFGLIFDKGGEEGVKAARRAQEAIVTATTNMIPAAGEALTSFLNQSMGSTIQETANNVSSALTQFARDTDDAAAQAEALRLAQLAQTGIAGENVEAFEQMVAGIAKFTNENSGSLSDFGRLSSNNFTAILKAQRQGEITLQADNRSETENRAIAIKAAENNFKALNESTENIQEPLNLLGNIMDTFANFGGDLMNLGILLIGLKNGLELISGLGGAGGLLATFGSKLSGLFPTLSEFGGAIGGAMKNLLTAMIGPAGAIIAMTAAAAALYNMRDELLDADYGMLGRDLLEKIGGTFGFKTEDQKRQEKLQGASDQQEQEIIVKYLKRNKKAITQDNIDLAIRKFRGENVDVSFMESVQDKSRKAFSLSGDPEDSFIPARGEGGGRAGTNKVVEQGAKPLPQPASNAGTAAVSQSVVPPTPVLTTQFQQLQAAKSQGDQLKLMNENLIIQTLILEEMLRQQGSGRDINDLLRRSGISLATARGNA
jgi:hypothetical protein